LHNRITSQLVALATQSRNASGLETLEELEELDDELPVGHMSLSASRQPALSRELLELDEDDEDDDDPGKHVWHLAMMLSTAFSHRDDDDGNDSGGQPVQPAINNTERANPRKARFMSLLPQYVKN
jgi:hypothetical protein